MARARATLPSWPISFALFATARWAGPAPSEALAVTRTCLGVLESLGQDRAIALPFVSGGSE